MTDTLSRTNPAPDVGVMRSHKPNLKIAEFGDGYSQRTAFGIQQTKLEVSLNYSNVITAEKAALESFVNAHASGQAFFFTMPDEVEARKFYFTDWKYVYVKAGIFNVSLSMVECFDI